MFSDIAVSLESNKKAVCISTQLVEAGVDFSFGCVMRIAAGLDNVIQAAVNLAALPGIHCQSARGTAGRTAVDTLDRVLLPTRRHGYTISAFIVAFVVA